MHQLESSVNALVDKAKYNEFSIVGDKLVTLYIFFNTSCPFESKVFSYSNSPKCMIKIFLDSVTKQP